MHAVKVGIRGYIKEDDRYEHISIAASECLCGIQARHPLWRDIGFSRTPADNDLPIADCMVHSPRHRQYNKSLMAKS